MSETTLEATEAFDIIKNSAEKFFGLMGIAVDAIEITTEEEKRRIYRVTIKTPDSKLLIGVHGQTLEHLRHLLTRLVERATEKSFLLHLEVNDYLQAKDERLFRRIEDRITALMRNGGEISLDLELSSYDRKKVHSYVADKNIPGLSTKSIGEGGGRALHLIYSGTPLGAPVKPEASERPTETPLRPRESSVKTPSYSSRMDGSDLSEDGVGI